MSGVKVFSLPVFKLFITGGASRRDSGGLNPDAESHGAGQAESSLTVYPGEETARGVGCVLVSCGVSTVFLADP